MMMMMGMDFYTTDKLMVRYIHSSGTSEIWEYSGT
jgi:hypothetical protein